MLAEDNVESETSNNQNQETDGYPSSVYDQVSKRKELTIVQEESSMGFRRVDKS